MLGAALIVALFAISYAVRVSGWALDETIVKQSALHYRHGLPGTLFHDLNARATSRLFSLLLMPVFALWDGNVAIAIARCVAAVFFCSTAIPVYLLARRVLRSPWFAAAAAVLAIAGPWLTLATTIYTENLAFPVFTWTLLAMVWAIERGTWRGDAVVVAAIAVCTVTRVQLFSLFIGWLIAIWAVCWARRRDRREFPRRVWRLAPVSHALLGLLVLFAFYRWTGGHLRADIRRLLGTYSELQDRGHFSYNTLLAVAHEAQAMALPAFLAAAASIAWFLGTLRAPRISTRWSFAVVALVVIAVLWLVSAYVQGGFLGDVTEERYFFYAFPLVWIGAFAALEEPAVARPRLLAGAVPLIMLFAVLGQPRPLDPQSTFLAPGAAVARSMAERLIGAWHLDGVSTQDFLAFVSIIVLLIGTWAWRRGARPRLAAWAFAAGAIQIAFTGYAFAARDGDIPNVPSQTGGIIQLNAWVDRHAGKDDVTWLNTQPQNIAPDAGGWQYATVFWNSRISDWAQDPAGGPPVPAPTLAALPMRLVAFDPATGLVKGLEHAGPFVTYVQSPFFQVAGHVLATGPGNNLELLAPAEPVQALWHSQHLELDGAVDPAHPAVLDAWVPPGSNAKRLRIKIVFQGPATGPGTIALQLGSQKRTVAMQASQAQTVTLEACVKGRHLTGTATGAQAAGLPDGRSSAGRFVTVSVQPAPGGSC